MKSSVYLILKRSNKKIKWIFLGFGYRENVLSLLKAVSFVMENAHITDNQTLYNHSISPLSIWRGKKNESVISPIQNFLDNGFYYIKKKLSICKTNKLPYICKCFLLCFLIYHHYINIYMHNIFLMIDSFILLLVVIFLEERMLSMQF